MNMREPITGAELMPIKIMQALVKCDSQTTYFVILKKSCSGIFDVADQNFREICYPNWLQNPILNILWFQFILPPLLHYFKIDILFANYNRVPFLSFKRTILLIHDLADYRILGKYDFWRSWYHRIMLKLSIAKAAIIVTVSENTKKDIIEFFGVDSKDVFIVYNGVDTNFCRLNKQESNVKIATKYGLSNPYIIYLGALEHPNKNLINLLKAYKFVIDNGFEEYDLVFVGPERLKVEIINQEIIRLGLQKRVKKMGYVPKEDLSLFLSGSELFVYPSLYEGFGIPVIEAMACGVPVIASSASSLPEVVGNAGILVDPYDVEAISSSIIKVLSDNTLRNDLIERGLEQAKVFSWTSSALKLKTIFHSNLHK